MGIPEELIDWFDAERSCGKVSKAFHGMSSRCRLDGFEPAANVLRSGFDRDRDDGGKVDPCLPDRRVNDFGTRS